MAEINNICQKEERDRGKNNLSLCTSSGSDCSGQISLPRRRPLRGDPGLLHGLLLLEVDVLLLGVGGQDGGGLANLHP